MQRAKPGHSGDSNNSEKFPSVSKFSNLRSEDKEPRMFTRESPRRSQAISRQRMMLWYMGILGYVSVQTKSKYVDDTHPAHVIDKGLLSEERIIVFRPSFWKTQLELHFVNVCGRISRTLSTDCVIDFKAPIFEMCRSGDVRGLKDAFYSGSVSLNVVDPLGRGLLHVSVVARPYAHQLKVDSMPRVAFRKTCVFVFSVWAWPLIVPV